MEKRIIHTWKEISDYIRIKTGDTYLNEESVRRLNRFFRMVPVFILFIVIFVFLYFAFFRGQEEAVDFRIAGSEFVFLTAEGERTGSFDTKFNDLITEEQYRMCFQKKNLKDDHVVCHPQLAIMDINNDGKNEVLLTIQTANYHSDGILYCLDRRGKEIWSFRTGRRMTYGTTEYSTDFWIQGFLIDDLDGDGNFEIIVMSNLKDYFPTQLTVIDSGGHMMGEYWNSGRIPDVVTEDLNNDGKKEIILASMNNEYRKACIIVFDHEKVSGGSPQQNDDYRCLSLKKGSELFYILLPRTDVNMVRSVTDSCSHIDILDNKRIYAWVNHIFIAFEFDYDLYLRNIHSSHVFEMLHRNALSSGLISSSLDGEYFKQLKRRILYYNGNNFVHNRAFVSSK